MRYVRWFEELTVSDVPLVGGKNASLGELVRNLRAEGVRIPDGFATTADAFRLYLEANTLTEKVAALLDEWQDGRASLQATGAKVRRLVAAGTIPEDVAHEVTDAYEALSRRYGSAETDVAVRSSATAEDLPTASFAGQQETYLNVTGAADVLDAVRRCYASLFTDRAISYRQDRHFGQMDVALSCGVQKMVRSDLAGSGVMFTIDTETGFPDVVVINAAWGLGETVVQGQVDPDEYRLFQPLLSDESLRPIVEKTLGEKARKLVYGTGVGARTKNVATTKGERDRFVLTEDEILQLGRWGDRIERHYGRPMDIEWAKDGQSGELFVVQARPETVVSQRLATQLRTYKLTAQPGKPLATGLSVGRGIAAGRAIVIRDPAEMDRFEDGAVLVTGMTDPDWVPVMRKASAIVTDHGGRTSHAAIVSRELGVPAVVGSGDATSVLASAGEITVDCAEGEAGFVYAGRVPFEAADVDLEGVEKPRVAVQMNIATPDAAFRWWRLPVAGIGLARMEFIIGETIRIHPMALVGFDQLKDAEAKAEIARLTHGYADKSAYFVDHLAWGVARIAASQYPDQVVVRTSDFKTNEYANLLGGSQFEPAEENPMLGFRGASRYYAYAYRDGFALECRALKRVREEMGLTNVVVMIPFCRTPEEADKVLAVMAANGLERGKAGLQVYMMAEIPSNVILADRFATRFDGFSIGSNDLTQLTLGVDRDSGTLGALFREDDEAVERFVAELIERAHAAGVHVGICGQAPSDHPEFAAYLDRLGIDAISLNPDSVLPVMRTLVAAEREAQGARR
jgi:pyruvate, water dikinase